MGGWYRAQVVSVDAETGACDIKFLDYGGYLTVDSSVLRQIRGDFMTLPFQAAECYLANVMPFGGTSFHSLLHPEINKLITME
jgi:A-kinase anchor protein 1